MPCVERGPICRRFSGIADERLIERPFRAILAEVKDFRKIVERFFW